MHPYTTNVVHFMSVWAAVVTPLSSASFKIADHLQILTKDTSWLHVSWSAVNCSCKVPL